MERIGRALKIGVFLISAFTLAAGGLQAAQARGTLRPSYDCPEQGNWCAESRGGQVNCDGCCQTPPGQSYCSFFDEDEPPFYPQGCVCG